MDVIEINSTTGEVTERAFTADEKSQRKTDAAIVENNAIVAASAVSERQATITAARDHAASLGFTDAMLAVMYPNLAP